MNVVQYIPAYDKETELEKLLSDDFLQSNPLPSFDDLSIKFLSGLSKVILSYPGIKTYPELVSLAFWLRQANISSIVSEFNKTFDDFQIIVPRGLALHVAPSNVDSIFLYSWALSLLAGNKNVVRVSRETNKQLELLLEIVREFISRAEWSEIKKRNIVISYPRENEINEYISVRSDLRVIWGGDLTIMKFKEIPSKPSTKDILFVDKFSYSIINAADYNSLVDQDKKTIARNFYNDAYWFDQMACSSPRFVLFTGGEDECEKASIIFWEHLGSELTKRDKHDTADIAMEKLVYMYETLSFSELPEVPQPLNSGKPAVIRVTRDEIKHSRESCGGGFFFECFFSSLDELIPLISLKDQTLTYSGFSKEELISFAKQANGKGIDRIVPIGKALDFSPAWDGYSLLNELTKRVNIIA